MTTPKLAESVRGRGRHYRHPELDELLPSVTNIISILDKPALPRWAAKLVAEQAAAMKTSLPNLEDEEIITILKGAPWRSSTRAADRGTDIHEWLEMRLLDFPDEMIPELEGEAVAFRAGAQAWLDSMDGMEPLHTEVTLFADRYAGTVDAIILHNDQRWMIDFKTSKAVYPEAALQLAALNMCDLAMIEDKPEDFEPCERLAVVRIGKDGKFEMKEVFDEGAHQDAFIAALDLWTWKHDTDPYKETDHA
jgi:hypothetical protein